MPNFVYTALDSTGKQVKGNVDAESQQLAIAKVKDMSLTPVKVEAATALNSEIQLSFVQPKPKPRDLSVFCRQMVSILSAGVPMAKALEMLGEQTEQKMLKEAIQGCKAKIEAGSSFSEAMLDYKCFPEIFSIMIKAGEESGSLETSFTRMAEKSEKDAKLAGLVKSAMMYPIIVAVIAVAVVIFMLVFIVPKFEDLLGQMGTEMPALTKAIVGASKFVIAKWYIVLGVIIAVVVAIKYFKKTEVGKHLLANIMLKIPLFGPLSVKTACSNTMRMMATLLSTGIPMIDAIEITSTTMTNVLFQEALQEVKTDVAQGMLLSESLERTQLYPPMIFHMTQVGEETGNLTEMFDRAANYYDEEVEEQTKAVTAAIEPLVICLLAGIVGTIIIALMMPMMSMYTGLDNL